MLTLSVSDYLWFVDQALGQMVGIVRELGDEAASTRPDLPGANSPYAILTHCLGVMEYWAGELVAGRDITRDRDAELVAAGSVEDLVARTTAVRRQLEEDLADLEPEAPLHRPPAFREDAALPWGRTQAGALLHVYEELAQHLGQMELSRDLLVAKRPRP